MYEEPVRRAGIPGYTLGAVAKVMISLPDDLLARIDVDARARQMSRSALIRDYIEAAQAERNRQLADLMAEIDAEPTRSHGGDVVADLKAARAELKR
jgi:predicted transcriptional regulator